MLIDKGYYDYDYECVKANAVVLYEDTVKSETETYNMLARFGIGKPCKKDNVEDLQKYVMNELQTTNTKQNG